MKTRESRLQNGIFVYKRGISLTKQESHLQNGILGVQTGLSGFYLPYTCQIKPLSNKTGLHCTNDVLHY